MGNLDVLWHVEGIKFFLIYNSGMYKEGMTIQEAYKEADTYGLSF